SRRTRRRRGCGGWSPRASSVGSRAVGSTSTAELLLHSTDGERWMDLDGTDHRAQRSVLGAYARSIRVRFEVSAGAFAAAAALRADRCGVGRARGQVEPVARTELDVLAIEVEHDRPFQAKQHLVVRMVVPTVAVTRTVAPRPGCGAAFR